MTTARDIGLTIVAIVVAALIRVVWQLANRVSRIEGRLNGKQD